LINSFRNLSSGTTIKKTFEVVHYDGVISSFEQTGDCSAEEVLLENSPEFQDLIVKSDLNPPTSQISKYQDSQSNGSDLPSPIQQQVNIFTN